MIYLRSWSNSDKILCNDFSYWSNPDKIDNIEHLRQMEDSLRESIERVRIHKVCCFVLVIMTSMHCFCTLSFKVNDT